MKPVPGMAIFVLAGAAWAQSDSELTARELFLLKVPAAATPAAPQKNNPVVKPKPVGKAPADKVAADKPMADPVPVANKNQRTPDGTARIEQAAYTPLALKYSILQKKGNDFEEVDADTQFHSGDRIRVRVEANGAAYLYIVMGGSSGQWRVLFPSKEIDGGNNRIQKGQPCIIPPESDPPFYFDETAGVEKVSLVLTRTPEPDLEKLIYAAGDPTRNGDEHRLMMAQNMAVDGLVMGRVREQLVSRDLVFEKYDGAAPDGKQEKAVYAASRDKSPDARLFVDLNLIHK